jgi:hypothetical protein
MCRTREASHGIPLAEPIGWTIIVGRTTMTETEIIERAIDPVAGDRFEWNGQVCEVKDVADIHNVGVIVHYTFTAYGKTTSLSEFLRVWPTRVRKTIAGGAVFIPSNK